MGFFKNAGINDFASEMDANLNNKNNINNNHFGDYRYEQRYVIASKPYDDTNGDGWQARIYLLSDFNYEFDKAADMLNKVANDKDVERLSKLVIKLAHEIDLRELGLAMMNWHSGQWDPIYMVASFFVDGKDYPDLDVVERALTEIKNIAGAGKVEDTEENISQLSYIWDGLKDYLESKLGTTAQDNNEAKDQDEELFEDT